MSGESTFMSPLVPGSLSRLVATSNEIYISPGTRRNVALTSPSSAGTSRLPLATENDDEAERKERRRSRVLEMQQRNITSPATPTSERRKSIPLQGLTNNQLTEHYTNCIKLSAENKINAKNAFGLHLIDYLSELIKKKEMNNFQVASSTLDASAKIYAGRVDAIHSETYKVLTGLGRGTGKHQKGESVNGEEPDDGDGGVPGPEKKRKRARKSNTIVQNLKNINVNKFDLEFEVDPLFQKTSAEFDEGGSGGLLLNHLRCFDDSSELILDSNTIVTGSHDLQLDKTRGTKLVQMKEFKDLYSGINLEMLQICPTFADFEFTNWNREGETTLSTVMSKLGKSDHVFDLDAEPEHLPDSQDTAIGSEVAMTAEDFMEEDHNDTGSEQPPQSIIGQDSIFGDGEEAKVVESAVNSIKHGTIGTLMQVLAAEPGEYSYFSANLLNTWKGPEHWKLKPRSKDPNQPFASAASGADRNKKPREKKAAFAIQYADVINFDDKFKETRAATTLTKATLDRYSKSATTLPEDLHYDADKLFRLFAKPKVMVRRQHGDSEDNVDDNIENYDYDNENDKHNFCPSIADGGDDDDDHHRAELDFPAGGNDFVTSQEEGTLSSQTSFQMDNTSLFECTLLTGDNLVTQPKKVAKIEIAYAKTAKKVDVKKLKSTMWSILGKPETPKEEIIKGEEGKKNEEQSSTEEKSKDYEGGNDDVAGRHSFKTLLKDLPSMLSTNMAKSLSVPIAFVCLLHLANEKTLSITSDEDMSDLKIVQG